MTCYWYVQDLPDDTRLLFVTRHESKHSCLAHGEFPVVDDWYILLYFLQRFLPPE